MKRFLKRHKLSLIILSICLVLSTAFVLLFSYSTSPLQGDNFFGGFVSKDIGYDGDTAQFLTIGREWANGQVPYRDAFDHKGPIIFLADAFGYLLGSKFFICLIQILCLTITLFFICKICQLATKNKLLLALTLGLSLLTLVCNYTDGNSVQEYCLPFITAATYFIYKFLLSKQKRHNYKIALLYGVCVGVCMMTQITNAVLIGAGIITIVGVLIKNKEFKNLGQNLLAGLVGIAVVCVPFAVYFACNNAFGEFLFSTFGYSIGYASQADTWLNHINEQQILVLITAYFGFLCIFPTIFFAFTRKKYSYGIFLSIAAVCETLLFCTNLLHQHYAMVVLVQVPLLLNELYLVKRTDTIRLVAEIICIILIAAAVYFQIIYYLCAWPHKVKMIHHPQSVGYENLVQNYIDDMRNTSTLVDGDLPVKDFYLKYNIPVSEKYFILQKWHSRYDSQVRDQIEDRFKNTTAKYILMDSTQWHRDIVEARYELLGQENGFSLYRLK